MSTRFELSKWYADCVTPEGGALILYHAVLAWRGPAIHYSSLLVRPAGGPTTSRFSLRRQPPPVERGAVEWRAPVWKAAGTWQPGSPPLQRVLFESPAGSVEWNCVVPRGDATVRAGAGLSFVGLGYAEHLRLTIPPWKLPIRRLRWGRFLNARDALVWIDWQGGHNIQVVYDNGRPAAADEIGDREIVLAGGAGVLALDCATILREGALGATALALIPNLERRFPGGLLGVLECKWLSRGVLRRPGQPDSAGLAIHEVVEWP